MSMAHLIFLDAISNLFRGLETTFTFAKKKRKKRKESLPSLLGGMPLARQTVSA